MPPPDRPAQSGAPPDRGTSYSDGSVRLLEPGKPIERELVSGESHSYRIDLSAGELLHVVVEQRGVDVAVALSGPDGRRFRETDSQKGATGAERILFVADQRGGYLLAVRSLEGQTNSGR
ncbi:MAG: hypothetical protein ACRD68_13405, partial [Pyrinomonadaceae bacterium]